jgi:Mg2+/Co2+ transporter CorB
LPDRKRLEVARALATDPKFLLLDEVMAGLRPNETTRIVNTLRDLNRRLSLELPLDGPKTLNGLLIERLEEIPDAPCCVRFDDVLVEVLHVDEHAVRSARVARIGAYQSALAAT